MDTRQPSNPAVRGVVALYRRHQIAANAGAWRARDARFGEYERAAAWLTERERAEARSLCFFWARHPEGLPEIQQVGDAK